MAVGETNIYVLNELNKKWDIVSSAPLEDNYRNNLNINRMKKKMYLNIKTWSPFCLNKTQNFFGGPIYHFF